MTLLPLIKFSATLFLVPSLSRRQSGVLHRWLVEAGNTAHSKASRMAGFALALILTACGLAMAQEMNVPGNWQHKQVGGQQIFISPSGTEGVSINPAPELASLGEPGKVLQNVLDQFKMQYPTMKVTASCQSSTNMAVAFIQRPGNTGPVSERVMASTGKGDATIILFWAPTATFDVEDRKLTGGQPSCPAMANKQVHPLPNNQVYPRGRTSGSAQNNWTPVPSSAQGPIPLSPLEGGKCKTVAPAGWRVTDQNNDGTTISLTSADGRLMSSYGALALNSGQARGLYGPQFRTPEAFLLYVVGMMTKEQAWMAGQEEQVGSYRAMHFTTASRRGYALVYRFPIAADPGGYGLILRIAIGSANDVRTVGIAGAVAAATECQAVTHPSTGPVWHAPKDDHGTGRTGRGSDGDLAGTYNAQLGTGWVHDGACRNYNVSVTDDYTSGPEGGGYYKHNGNDTIKLEPGMC